MDRTRAPYSEGGQFVDADPANGVLNGTRIVAADMNALQEEIVNVIEDAGLNPNAANLNQLSIAISALITAAGIGDFLPLTGGLLSGNVSLQRSTPNFTLFDTADPPNLLRLLIFSETPRIAIKRGGTLRIEGEAASGILDVVIVIDDGTTPQGDPIQRLETVIHTGNLLANLPAPEEMILLDRRSAGVDGSAVSVGSWQPMAINTTRKNTIPGASRAGTQFTLSEPGDYVIEGYRVIASANNGMQTRIRNVSAGSDVESGATVHCASGADASGQISIFRGEVSISEPTSYQIENFSNATNGARLYGEDIGSGVANTYGMVQVRKI